MWERYGTINIQGMEDTWPLSSTKKDTQRKKSKNNKTPEDTKIWGDTGVGEALV